MAPRGPVALLLLLAVAAPLPVQGELTPAGPEFQVNTYTTGRQTTPQVAMDAAGRFLVVWQSGDFFGLGQDGGGAGIFGQRFGSDGVAVGSEFRVNTFTPGPQFEPSVAADPAGRFTVAWTSGTFGTFYPAQDGSTLGAFVQRYDATGLPLGGEFQANTYTTERQRQTAVGVDAAGNFVVVWVSSNYGAAAQDGSDGGIFAQRYDSTGAPLGPEFQVNTYTTGYQGYPAVAVDPSGSFVVAWQSAGYYTDQDGSGAGVFARRFDSTGVPQGPDFQANVYTTEDQSNPAVAATGGGTFVVVWQSGRYYSGSGQDGSSTGVFARRFDSAGTPFGPEFQVNTYTSHSQNYPDVAADAVGNFVVVWTSSYTDQDGDADGIFGQHFTSTGVPSGPEFQVNTYTDGYQNGGSVAGGPDGRFVIAWTGAYQQDGSGQGVFAQRFRAVGPLRPLAGSRLALHDDANATRRKLLVRSTDAGITLGGGNGSADDPTLSGGHLRVRSAAFDHTYDLPAHNWTTMGPPGANQGYRYRDPFLFAGPVASVKVRSGRRISISAKGSQLLHTLAGNPDPVTITLQTGDVGHRYCFKFGGATNFRPSERFRAHGAPAACP